MDLKSIAFGGAFTLLGVLAGGGIYGFYVNQSAKLAYGEITAYTLMGECAILESRQYPEPNDINAFLSKLERNAPNVFASLTVVGAITGQNEGAKSLAVQVNDSLAMCAQQLKSKVK